VGGHRHVLADLPVYRRLGGTQGRSERVRKISPPTGIRSPYRTARSESLYRLSYPGHLHQNLDLRETQGKWKTWDEINPFSKTQYRHIILILTTLLRYKYISFTIFRHIIPNLNKYGACGHKGSTNADHCEQICLNTCSYASHGRIWGFWRQSSSHTLRRALQEFEWLSSVPSALFSVHYLRASEKPLENVCDLSRRKQNIFILPKIEPWALCRPDRSSSNYTNWASTTLIF
jgi:hypothetical protein